MKRKEGMKKMVLHTNCPLTQDDLTDIHLYLNLMLLRHYQTKSKVSNCDRLEELVEKIEKWIKDEGIRR